MGGTIAASFAADHPEMVTSLALLDAAGVVSPVKSDLTELLERGVNPFLVKDTRDFERLAALAYLNPPPMPAFIRRYLAKEYMKAAAQYEGRWKDMLTDVSLLERRLPSIVAPTLVAWGDSDRMLHVSSVPVFRSNIRNSSAVIIKECGHVPMVEKPAETARIYREFLVAHR
jgi:pimeloyl-ACP methyl ester carboxylesterase